MDKSFDEVSALIVHAEELQDQGKLSEAIEAFGRIIEARETPELYNKRGIAFAENGDAQAALSDYTRGLSLAPADPELLTNRGNAFLTVGDYAAAIADYNAALATGAAMVLAHAYNGRGWARWKSGDSNMAIRDFKEAIRVEEEYASPYYNLALVLFSLERSDKALPYLDRALQLTPDDVATLCLRSDVLRQLGRLPEALNECIRAHNVDELDPEPRWRIAWLRSTCNDPPALRDGKNAWEHAVAACDATNWADTASLSALAAACAECGKFQEAVDWQKRVVELTEGTDRDLACERLKRLKEGRPLRFGGGTAELIDALDDLVEVLPELFEDLG